MYSTDISSLTSTCLPVIGLVTLGILAFYLLCVRPNLQNIQDARAQKQTSRRQDRRFYQDHTRKPDDN